MGIFEKNKDRRAAGLLALLAVTTTVVSCGTEPEENQRLLAQCQKVGSESKNIDATDAPTGAAVATSDPYASEAACEALAKGGTAADAAVAAQLVLGLTEPQVSGPGGGSVAMYRDGRSKEVSSYDSTVYAPADYKPSDDVVASIGVPSTLPLLRKLNRDDGRLDLEALAQPAIRLAVEGFRVSDRLADAAVSAGYPELTRNLYGKDELVAGDIVTNERYGQFIEGWAASSGKLSKRDIKTLAKEMGDQGASASAENLVNTWIKNRNGSPDSREPRCVIYEQSQVCGIDSPATGSNIVLPSLSILNHEDLKRLTPYENDGFRVARSTAAHLMIEAERIAFTEANTWMGDPGDDGELAQLSERFKNEIVLNPDYAKRAAEEIEQKQSIRSPEPTHLSDAPYRDFFEDGTTQISISDQDGNVISMTSTLQKFFGTGITVGGFPLNNSLDNFTAKSPDEQNAPLPLRHPKTTMSPVLVSGKDGTTTAVGSPGGTNIPSYVVKNVVATQGWGLSPSEAVEMPNFGTTTRSACYVETVGEYSELPDVIRMKKLLDEWGHEVNTGSAKSGANLVVRSPKSASAAADHRRDGAALAAGR